jgi:membrane-anchored protein YejM (alkaline phosphatase superfamily)
MLEDDDLPHISGVHGVFKGLAKDEMATSAIKTGEDEFFDDAAMKALHAQQVTCVEYVDKLLGKLMEKLPENTHVIVTADHGELFGEGNYFGHGPIMHEKVFEVPFVEGKRP